jgi:hypothetical protein
MKVDKNQSFDSMRKQQFDGGGVFVVVALDE